MIKYFLFQSVQTLLQGYWGEHEQAPTLLMSMEIMEIMCVRVYVCPRLTARLHMREHCSNSAELVGF